MAAEISLSAELLDQVHPFYVAFDSSRTIRQIGSAMALLMSGPLTDVGWQTDMPLGAPLANYARIVWPALEQDAHAVLLPPNAQRDEVPREPMILEVGGVRLSGPLLPVPAKGWCLFLGSPTIPSLCAGDALDARLREQSGDFSNVEVYRQGVLAARRAELRQADQHAHQAREESESRYLSVINSLGQVVFQADAGGRFTFLNEAWKTLLGHEVAASLQTNLAQYVLAEDMAVHESNVRRLLEEEQSECRYLVRLQAARINAPFVAPLDRIRWVGVNIRTTRDEAGALAGFSGTLTDITERKRAEQERADALNERAKALGERETAVGALRESEAYLRTVIGNAPLVLFAQNGEGRFTLFEGSGTEAMRVNAREALGRFASDVFTDRPDLCREFERARTGETFTSVSDNGTHVFETRYSPIRATNDAAQTNGFIAVATDITERVRAEERLRDLALDLQRSNQVLQDFASVASHDLQEPLRKIQAFGGRLKRSLGENLGEDAADYLERMLSSASRMQLLLNDLLAFSRVTTKGRPFEAVDMNIVAERAVSDMETRMQKSGAKIVVEPLPTIEADPSQMRQLLLNLIANAIKFQRAEVAPAITVRAKILRDRRRGGRVICRLQVEDNGMGFEERYRERIFEVFEKLHNKGEYEGTGMGLAICRKIVERHGGTITARSAPGYGSTFSIVLPLRHEPLSNGGAPPAAAESDETMEMNEEDADDFSLAKPADGADGDRSGLSFDHKIGV